MLKSPIPEPMALFFRSVLIGLVLSALFTGMILGSDFAGIGGLVARSDVGWIAVAAFWIFNAIIFGSVQFAYVVMSMAEDDDDDGPQGGAPEVVPVRIR